MSISTAGATAHDGQGENGAVVGGRQGQDSEARVRSAARAQNRRLHYPDGSTQSAEREIPGSKSCPGHL